MYYKMNVPDKVFVVKAKSIAEIVCFIVNETEDADLADSKENPNQSFFSIEPLTEDLTVKGINYKKAIDDEVQSLIDNGYYGDEEDYADDWVIILEADEDSGTWLECEAMPISMYKEN